MLQERKEENMRTVLLTYTSLETQEAYLLLKQVVPAVAANCPGLPVWNSVMLYILMLSCCM